MACFGYEASEEDEKSRMIDKNLKKESSLRQNEMRILILGAGESGKSTFLKQMRIIHGLGFDHDAIVDFQQIIYFNTVQGMRVLLDAHEKLQIPWENESTKPYCDQLMSHNTSFINKFTFMKLAPAIERCWNDSSVKQVFDNRNLFQVSDSIKIFFENIERISDKDWLPNNEDILYARKATKGFVELSLSIKNVLFKFIDVGGQRSQRAKWLSLFDNVTSVLFMVATSEFNQVLLEDRKTNRLQESKIIFDALINNCFFAHISFILFFNKFDLLTSKVKSGFKLSQYFPEFRGNDSSIDDVKNFISNSFLELQKKKTEKLIKEKEKEKRESRKNKKSRYFVKKVQIDSELYFHFTTAVDTKNISVVSNDVNDHIFKKNLKNFFFH